MNNFVLMKNESYIERESFMKTRRILIQYVVKIIFNVIPYVLFALSFSIPYILLSINGTIIKLKKYYLKYN